MNPELLLALLDRQYMLLAGAGLAGLTVTLLVRQINLGMVLGPPEAKVLADYLAPYAASGERPDRLHINPEAVILAGLGLPFRPGRLRQLRIAAALLPALLLLLVGFPLVPSLAGGALGYVLVDAWLQGRWRTFRNRIEQELPTFVSRLAGLLLVTESTTRALEEVIDTLEAQNPLRVWMEAFLLGIREEGVRFMEHARTHAAVISPSLALVVFELGRFYETGGAGFAQAFATTADELSSILEARAVAASKAEGARTAVLSMLVIMAVIMGLMLSSPSIRAGFNDPTAQLVALGALSAMAYGYLFLNGMIQDALES